MYAFISGKVDHVNSDGLVVVNNNGIGYNIVVSGNTLSKLPRVGEDVKLYTYNHIKEDTFALYGFVHFDEKRMFEKLININGVGCKMAIGILSGVDSATLAVSIASSDTASLSKIKGVGKKTAERIILELKEKVDISEFTSSGVDNVGVAASMEINDAVTALVSLGIGKMDAYKAVMKASETATTTNAMITLALRGMDR